MSRQDPRETRILIAEPTGFSSKALEILGPVGEVVQQETSTEQLPTAFDQYDVVWVRLGLRVDRSSLGDRPRCRILASPVTGLDHIDMEACERLGIQVITLRGEVSFLRDIRATAELTVGLMLALLRHIPEAARSVQAGQWHRDLFRGRELFRKTAGIIGVGRLGTIVAGYLRSFGMDVLGYDRCADFPHEAAARVETLGELLERSDVVTIHVAFDRTTRHLIGLREFSRMRPGAVLINTSRGGVVDEQALLQALESGRLAGAALDVLDGEPHITADHPVVAYARTHANVVVVPHIGGNTIESVEQTECFLARRVVEVLVRLHQNGQTPLGDGQVPLSLQAT